MARVAVIGGGMAGSAAALALARQGHEVCVLEQDANAAAPGPEDAFARWTRRGAPQARHSHAFLARLRLLLRERAPDLLEALHEAGAGELRFLEALPANMSDREPRPEDSELVALACRRLTFDWALQRLLAREDRIRLRAGVRVVGLLAEFDAATGGLRVTGVRHQASSAGGSTEERADVVVDASGGRSSVVRWLAELGAPPPDEQSEDCGIFYCTRFYRLRPGAQEPPREGPIGADLGYMKYAVFPGDRGVFSVTLAAAPEDAPLRALLRPEPFAAAAAALPITRPWIDPARAEPLGPVHAMAKLRSRRRRFVRDGRPVAPGLFVIGDAAVCTNPLYGRGCTLAFLQAFLLADALEAHAGDPCESALALDRETRARIEPWYESARLQDRDARDVAAAERRGESPAAEPWMPASSSPVDPRRFARSLMREGLLPALEKDGVVLRAFLRGFNLLDPPDALLRDPEVARRVLAAWQRRAAASGQTPAVAEGPARAEMLRVLERAA